MGLQRYDEAERFLKQTLEFAHQQREGALGAITYADLSTIRLRQGRYEEAVRLAREALAQDNDQDLAGSAFSSPWPLHLALGRALRAGGHRKGATEAFRAAVGTVQAERDELPAASARHFH